MEPSPPEIVLAKVWQTQWLRSGNWHTTDGKPIAVRYRGRWSGGFGPDFADALLTLDGQETTGAVELHRRASDWRAHGHHLDPAYAAVALHVVWEDDGVPARTRRGNVLPTLVLAPLLASSLDRFPADTVALGGLGDTPCARDYLDSTGDDLPRIIGRAGDTRLAAKAAAMEAQFATAPPGDTLYAGILDALGYHANRSPMATLAAALPLLTLERQMYATPAAMHEMTAAALLLGTGGFFDTDARPLPPFVQRADDLRACWQRVAPATLSPAPIWQTARVRPANHPIRRLLAFAALLAHGAGEGLTAACLAPLADGGDDPRALIRALRQTFRPHSRFVMGDASPIGADRAGEIIINIVLPFALAYGLQTENMLLVAGAERAWECFPATAGNAITAAMTAQLAGNLPHTLRIRTGRLQQGLIALYHARCRARQCDTCPVATLERLTVDG